MRTVREVQFFVLLFGIGLLCGFGRGSEIADANQLFVLEKYEDAIGLYQEVAAEESQEKAPEALFGLARTHQMLGQWKAARDVFQWLLREYPESEFASNASMQVGQCEVKLGNLGKALEVFREIEQKYAGEEEAIEAKYNIANLNVGSFDGDVRKALAAIEGYRSVLGSDRGDRYLIQSNFGLGQCYMLLQEYDRAIRSFRVVVERGPGSVWADYARGRIASAQRVFGDLKQESRIRGQDRFWRDFSPRLRESLGADERFSSRWPGGVDALRVQSFDFFTEPREVNAKVKKVFYVKPTIHYKRYVFRSDQGAVDRERRSVQCAGNVKCTDDVVPPTVTVTCRALTLDLNLDKAIFSLDVKFERREGEQTTQQLLVPELHLMLDSGKVEVPPKESGLASSSILELNRPLEE
jgi:TolA-binding protein